jgi:hypothetical protein
MTSKNVQRAGRQMYDFGAGKPNSGATITLRTSTRSPSRSRKYVHLQLGEIFPLPTLNNSIYYQLILFASILSTTLSQDDTFPMKIDFANRCAICIIF